MGEPTWLTDAPDAGLGSVLAARPDLAERYGVLAAGLWASGVDPGLLELCRIRLAQVVGDGAGAALRSPEAAGALDETLVAHLDAWWSHEGFDAVPRAALGITEQFAVDVHGVSDERFAELAGHLGPAGAVGLSFALALFDGQSRLRLAFAAVPAGPSPMEVAP
jgi:hypothetical protein